jgi:hypothetical protein
MSCVEDGPFVHTLAPRELNDDGNPIEIDPPAYTLSRFEPLEDVALDDDAPSGECPSRLAFRDVDYGVLLRCDVCDRVVSYEDSGYYLGLGLHTLTRLHDKPQLDPRP